MKRKVFFIIALLLVCVFFPEKSLADAGPKPTVTFSIEGLGDREYFATLLSKKDSTGPYSYEENPTYSLGDQGLAEKAFHDFIDLDGYYYISFISEKIRGEGDLFWSYYPPSDFKLALYLVDEDRLLVSESYSAYAFNSKYKADFSSLDLEKLKDSYVDSSQVKITKNYNYFLEIFLFILRCASTIAIELLVAVVFFRPSIYQKKLLIKINIITQILLNIILALVIYLYGLFAYLFWLFILEILVFIVEGAYYKSRLNRNSGDKVIRPYLFSFILNLASFGLSFYLGLVFFRYIEKFL